tara:strand:+ start:1377 stop:1640 length:264 start_codon:yes stop_codon:yes gene_type:complete
MTVYENYIEFAKREIGTSLGAHVSDYAKKVVEEAEKLKAGTITKDEFRAATPYLDDNNLDLAHARTARDQRMGINYLRDRIVDWYPN